MNVLFAMRNLETVACVKNLKMLRSYKFMFLAQEADIRSLRIQNLTNGYDENIFWLITLQTAKKLFLY